MNEPNEGEVTDPRYNPPSEPQTPDVLLTAAADREEEVPRVAHAAPGKPDGEVDTRADAPEWREPWRDGGPDAGDEDPVSPPDGAG